MLTFPCASTSLSSYHIKCWHILQTSLFTSPNLHQNYFVTMSVKLACTPTTLLFFLTPVWLVQYQDKMYRMRGNADSASLFLDSVSRWCSLLARKQWVMLKPMDVNCQATGAWQRGHQIQYVVLISKHPAGGSFAGVLPWCDSGWLRLAFCITD